MDPRTDDLGFHRDHPEIWDRLQNVESGVSDNRSFYSLRVAPLLHSEGVVGLADAPWMLVKHVPSSVTQERRLLQEGVLVAFALLSPLLGGIGWLLGRAQVRNAWQRRELERQATKDALTGLDNRRAVYDKLQGLFAQAVRHERALTLAFIDVDGLKRVNDDLGHEQGDAMIVAAGRALQQTTRTGDVVARVGGDEFVVLFPDCDEQNANLAMRRAARTFEAMGFDDGHPWSFSWGCAEQSPDHLQPDDLVRAADLAMFERKRREHRERPFQPQTGSVA